MQEATRLVPRYKGPPSFSVVGLQARPRLAGISYSAGRITTTEPPYLSRPSPSHSLFLSAPEPLFYLALLLRPLLHSLHSPRRLCSRGTNILPLFVARGSLAQFHNIDLLDARFRV